MMFTLRADIDKRLPLFGPVSASAARFRSSQFDVCFRSDLLPLLLLSYFVSPLIPAFVYASPLVPVFARLAVRFWPTHD